MMMPKPYNRAEPNFLSMTPFNTEVTTTPRYMHNW